MSCLAIDVASLTGIAKPMPMLPDWPPEEEPSEAIEELMPIELAARVDQGAAAVAGVDRRGGLDRVGHDGSPCGLACWPNWVLLGRLALGLGGDRAVEGADDAGGDGAGQAERVADGHDRVADGDLVGVADRDRGEVARGVLDRDDGQVGRGVGAADLGVVGAAVGEGHGELLGAGDDVVVGEHVARLVDDDAGALAAALARWWR